MRCICERDEQGNLAHPGGDLRCPLHPHKCVTPATGVPGNEWECPVCFKHWWCDDTEEEFYPVIEWREDDARLT